MSPTIARTASLKAVLILSAALAASLVGNAVLFWQLAQAKPAAKLECVQDALEATVAAERAEDARDATAGEIIRDTAATAEQAAVAAQADTDAVKTEIRYVYLTAPAPAAGSCTGEPPAGVRDRLEALRERANAAGG